MAILVSSLVSLSVLFTALVIRARAKTSSSMKEEMRIEIVNPEQRDEDINRPPSGVDLPPRIPQFRYSISKVGSLVRASFVTSAQETSSTCSTPTAPQERAVLENGTINPAFLHVSL